MKRAALITGSNGLIGRELCREFISQGFHVYGVDLKSQEKKENFTPVMCDISKEEEVAGVFQNIEALHVLINNGAKSDPYNKKIHELELSEWNKIMAAQSHQCLSPVKVCSPSYKEDSRSDYQYFLHPP